jgi:hypothetical protein
MSVVEGAKPQSLVARVQGILLRPKAEWEVIAGESATVQGLFFGYAAILAAIPAVARMVGSLFPVCVFGICVHINPVFAVVGAVVNYVVSLVGVYVIGLIINALAPSFGGEQNQLQAMKVAVYSFTAAWLAGIFAIYPPISLLGILLGLYSFYLLYVGLPALMKSPADKALGYTIVSIFCGVVVFILALLVGGAVTAVGSGMPGASLTGPSGTVSVGGASVDLGKMQSAARQMENAARQMQSGEAANGGKVVAVDPTLLKNLLPDSIAGVPRTEISSASGGAGGIGGSSAEGVYQAGDKHITVTVTDMAAAGAFASMASAFNVNTDKQTSTGYEKVSTQNGQLVHERYDNQSKNGDFSIVVASRFSIDAEGSGVSMDDLKAAVAAVGPARVAAMAHG